jgi:hypothetical protein
VVRLVVQSGSSAKYAATTMFARFRQVRDRLGVSLVEATRIGAMVRQTDIASLGSVPSAVVTC